MQSLLLAAALALGPPAVSAQAPAPTPIPAPTPAPAPASPYGAWGVDLAARDLAVRPGDDFQRYATGAWMDAHPIPANRSALSTGASVEERTQLALRRLIVAAPAGTRYGALYRSYVDEPAVEAAGDAPLRADLAAIAAIGDKAAAARAMGRALGGYGAAVVTLSVEPDSADPTRNVLSIGQSGLGLPDRDYYLAASFAPQRDAYQAYIARTFAMLGHADPAADAASVFAFEAAIASASWPLADTRNVDKINNPMSSGALASYAPGLDWNALLDGAGIGPQRRIIVEENTAVRDIAALVGAAPLMTLKLWQEFRTADAAAPYLTKAWVDSKFALDKALSGVTAPPPRWRRGVDLVDTLVGDDVGRAYVRAHFPPAAKAKMDALVIRLKTAMAERLRANDWMSPATRRAALNKLARMQVMVGYPDAFRDFAALRLEPGDLYGNVARAKAYNFAYDRADLGHPVDRRKWQANAQEVDAYSAPQTNVIVFPAGILQVPFFNPDADDAVNYGAIGAIIGHEISHGFDDQGRKFTADGAVRDWWANGDGARFEARAKALGAQYARFEAAPGAFINPALTMGENIADYAGLEIALTAYHRSLGRHPAPVRDGLSGDQRFFLAYAQAFRGVAREDVIRRQLASDPHSPRRYRVLGPIRNMAEWYAAFAVQPGDTLYLPPERRVRIW